MARPIFISEGFFKENSAVDENVDMKQINPTIGNVRFNTFKTY